MRKEWFTSQGRTFLIEKLQYRAVRDELRRLGLQARAPLARSKKTVLASARTVPPPLAKTRSPREKIKLALARPQEPAFVADYEIIIIDANNQPALLEGDKTYLVTDYFYAPELTIEGGCVIKMDRYQDVGIEADTLNCVGQDYHPAYITGVDDDTVGETAASSTGVPDDDRYSGNGLLLYSCPTGVKHLNLRYTAIGLVLQTVDAVTVSDCQFTYCQTPFFSWSGELDVRNCLFSTVGTFFSGGEFTTVNCQNCTLDTFGAPEARYNQVPFVSFVNCILANSDFAVDPRTSRSTASGTTPTITASPSTASRAAARHSAGTSSPVTTRLS